MKLENKRKGGKLSRYWPAFLLIAFLLFVPISINSFVESQYGLGIKEYIERSMPLTKKEKQWLQNNQLIFGADNQAPPLRFVDQETGQYRGISIDIVKAISIYLGCDIQFQPYTFNDALQALKEGKSQMFDIFPSEERAKTYLFTDEIYEIRGIILTANLRSNIHSAQDLNGLRVATPKGDYSVEFFSEQGINVRWSTEVNIQDCIQLLQDGKVDAVIGDETVVRYYKERMDAQDSLIVVDNPLYKLGVVFALNRSQPILQDILNKAILQMKKNDLLPKIQQKWFGLSVSEISRRAFMNYAFMGEMLLLGLWMTLTFFVLWNRRLNREVEVRTEDLFNSQNDLQTTFDGITYLMAVINETEEIVNVNTAFCRAVGQKKSAVIGKPCASYKPLLFGERSFDSIWERLKHEEIRYQHQTDRLFQTDIFPIKDQEGYLKRALFVLKDITEISLIQNQLQQAEKMVMVGQMAAGVAHEIRNPLGIIKSHAYLLKRQLGTVADVTLKSIGAIESSVDRAASIVDKLLNYSRTSSNGGERIELEPFLREMLDLQFASMKTDGIAMHLDCSKGLLCTVQLESLKHIIVNLVTNAILAMPDGGDLFVSCYKVADSLELVIRDTGVGIPKGNIETIFFPFFTTREPGKGTGLGLYVVYNEVKRCGGDISLSSDEGKGSTFTVRLRAVFPDILKRGGQT